MSVWYGGATPYSKLNKREGGMTGERAEKFFKASEKHMDEWIKCLGVRCSGSIVDRIFKYTEHLL